jgi:hypothetical protein
MAAIALRSEERIGLAVAVVAHAALVALLVWRPQSAALVTPPDRIEVTISDEVGLKSTSPEPNAQAAPDIAPEIGEPPPPAPAAAPPAPEPLPPEPQKAEAKPEPRPVAKPTMQPEARPKPTTAARPANRPPPLPGMAPAGSNQSATAKPVARPGGSRIGADFLKGVPGAQSSGQAHNPPAATIGPDVKASIGQAIARQLKPHWVAPQGADAELLVTLVRFHLARDGSLVGEPEVVGQSGETPANAAQKARHAEQAIRAVRLAAPFSLPPEYYSAWQTVTSRFDKRLSQ